jgi:opacity protein-like surface antigen
MAALHLMVNCAVALERRVHKILLAAGLYSLSTFVQSQTVEESRFAHALYGGGSLGYGSTTWYGLVPQEEKQNINMALYTPISAREGGVVWGGVAGYEFTPQFALEINYQHYPDANMTFDEVSLFAIDHNDNRVLNSNTEVVFVLAKFMLLIPNTPARVYSGFGIGDVHRNDLINNHWQFSPSFGAGINYTATPHVMAELAANYTAGYGESELNPVNDYVPFLYSICAKLIYRI